MVEIAAPRSKLLLRLLFVLAVLAAGLAFVQTQSVDAAANDQTISIVDTNFVPGTATDPVPPGATFDYVVSIDDVTDGIDPGFTVVNFNFASSTAVLGVDYTIGAATGTDWSCSFILANLISCIDSAPPRLDGWNYSDVTIPITVLPGATHGRVITVTSSTNATGYPESTDSNTEVESTTIAILGDLSVTKSDNVTTAVGGGFGDPANDFDYSISVTNAGPSVLPGPIIFVDTLPDLIPGTPQAGSDLSWDLGNSNTGSFVCATSGPENRTITCTAAGPLIVGGALTAILNVNVPTNRYGDYSIANTVNVCNASTPACFGGGATDPDTTNNTATENTTVLANADLGITKAETVPPPGAGIGETFTYTLTFQNAGPNSATLVTVRDILTDPSGTASILSIVPAVPAHWICDAGGVGTIQVECDFVGPVPGSPINVIPAGYNTTFTVTVTSPASGTPRTINNSADILSGTGQIPNNLNDQSDVDTALAAIADLNVVKNVTTPPAATAVYAGDPVTYTITVTNQGPSDAPIGAFSVGDSLPAQFAGTSLVETAFNCSTNAAFPTGGGSVTCVNDVVILAGASATIVINGTMLASTPAGTSVCNGASGVVNVTFATDPDATDNDGLGTDANDADERVCVRVDTKADLTVTKTDSPDPVLVNGNITYAITLTNLGPSASVLPRLVDTVPAGTILQSFSLGAGAAGFTCQADLPPAGGGFVPVAVGQPAGTIIQCDAPTLAVGSASFQMVVQVQPGATSPVSNTATVTEESPVHDDPDDTNNTATATTTILLADVQIVKSAAPFPTATVGSNVVWTIVVTNLGPSAIPAGALTVSDGLDAAKTFQSLFAPANWNCTTPPVGTNFGPAFACTNATDLIPALASRTFVLTTGIPASTVAGAQVCNGASSVLTPNADPNSTNNDGTGTPANADDDFVCVTAVTVADLTVSKTDTPDPVLVDGNITYSIVVTNLGPNASVLPRLVDTVPAGTILQSFTLGAGAAGFTCQADLPPAGGGFVPVAVGQPAGTIIQCDAPTLAVGSASFQMVVQVQPGAVSPITNAATVTEESPVHDDPDDTNNTAIATTTIFIADVLIEKSASPLAFVPVGTNVVWTIRVNNLGPSAIPAGALSFSDGVAAPNTFQSLVAPANWTCTTPPVGSSGTTVTCINSTDLIPPGAQRVFTLTTGIPASTLAGAQVCNGASTVLNPNADPNSLNNDGTGTPTNGDDDYVCLTAVTVSDLVVTKVGPSTAAPGDNITYTVVVNNTGPNAASSPVLTDTLPAGVTFVATTSTPAGWSCAHAAGVITCTGPASMAAGASAIFQFQVSVNAAAVGPLVNTACVVPTGANNSDPDDPTPLTPFTCAEATATDNTSTASTAIVLRADLSIVKSSPNPVYAGQTLVYTIDIQNFGPNVAEDVIVTDVLPSGLTFVSTTLPNSITALPCTQAELAVGCNIGDLAVGQFQYTITVTLNPDASSGFGPGQFRDQTCAFSGDPSPGTQVCNRISISSTSTDANLLNNVDDEVDNVLMSSDLGVTKTDNVPGNGAPGGPLTYTITVTNAGPSNTNGVVQFSDSLSAGQTLTALGVPAGVTCTTLTFQPITFPQVGPFAFQCTSSAPLGPTNPPVLGGVAPIVVTATVTMDSGPSISNTVTLNVVNMNDTNPANNSATVTQIVAVNNGISGTKFLDINGNGVVDGADAPLGAGWVFFVDNGQGAGGVANDGIKNGTEPSGTTNAAGDYVISGLTGNGPFRVCEVPQAGFTQTGAAPPVVAGDVASSSVDASKCVVFSFVANANPNKSASDVDFFNFQNFTIDGLKYEDVNGNGNGILEAGEAGVDIPGITFWVDYDNDGILDAGEPTGTQIGGGPIGDWRISNVGPCPGGTCYIREVRTAGWLQTYPNLLSPVVVGPPGSTNYGKPYVVTTGVPIYPYDPAKSDNGGPLTNTFNPNPSFANPVAIPAVPGQTVTGVLFGNFKLAVVTGVKFRDSDGDAVAANGQEPGEIGLAGFRICRADPTGSVNTCDASDTEVDTGINGAYTLLIGPNSPATICENLVTSPSGWIQTFPATSPPNSCYTLTYDSGDTIDDIDFGNRQGIINGIKFHDKNADGARQSSGANGIPGDGDDEVLLAGWRICALPVASDGICDAADPYQAITDANGAFSIQNVPLNATYVVREEQQVGWVQTTPNPANVTLSLVNNLITGITFGNRLTLPPVDLSIVKTQPAQVQAGTNFQVTLAVRNNDLANPAINVVVRDPIVGNLDPDATYVSYVAPAGWTCTLNAGPFLTCTKASLAPNTTENIVFTFTAGAAGTSFVNNAVVSADNSDPATANNQSATVTTAIVSQPPPPPPAAGADLRIDKAADFPVPAANQDNRYRIRVRNMGPSTAISVTMTDNMATNGALFKSISKPAGWTCTTPPVNQTGTVTCTTASMVKNASATFTILAKMPAVRPPDGFPFNTATVSAASPVDPNPANNSAVGSSTTLP